MNELIQFNLPYMTGKELYYIAKAHFNGRLAGDGPFTAKCHAWLEKHAQSSKALLTHSCTAALEMSALLLDIKEGDEIIMPSYTFVSTANAFALRGGCPVFVDIRQDTLNIDENKIEHAITKKTKAIVVVHYAGVACNMKIIMKIAKAYNLHVVEDAAQAVMSYYEDKPLGSIGDLGAYSFHETKNIISGEGGAILVNDKNLSDRSEIIREKGTDRSRFFRGMVDKYTWQDIGSSYLPGEIIAAFLWAQMEDAKSITERRMTIWNNYYYQFDRDEKKGILQRPYIPNDCIHNAHMFFILLKKPEDRPRLIAYMKKMNIQAIFHYVPLHSAPYGQRVGRVSGDLSVTNFSANTIVRLPLWIGMDESHVERVVTAVRSGLEYLQKTD